VKQYDQLIAIGCSHTYGAETIGAGCNGDPENLNYSWAAYLGQKLGCPVVNLSRCGSSNDWIYYTLSQYLLTTTITPDTLIIVQWTYPHRILGFNPDNINESVNITPATLDLDEGNLSPNTSPYSFPPSFWAWNRSFKDSYVNYMATDSRNVLNTWTNSSLLQAALPNFHYWPVWPLDVHRIPRQYQALANHYGQNSMTVPDYNWWNKMFACGVTQPLSGRHFGRQAQEWWAGKLYHYLDTGEKIA
jgi:hypothetical protein